MINEYIRLMARLSSDEIAEMCVPSYRIWSIEKLNRARPINSIFGRDHFFDGIVTDPCRDACYAIFYNWNQKNLVRITRNDMKFFYRIVKKWNDDLRNYYNKLWC